MRRLRLCLSLAFVLFHVASTFADDRLRLNQLQVIGTHNSYHVAPDNDVLQALANVLPDTAATLDYTHRPLAEQFGGLGIRQIELDLFADPEGGRYARPKAPGARAKEEARVDPAMSEPGFKVFHVPDIDQRTTVSTFAGALRQVRDWSKAHPQHVPILILVELKDDPIPSLTLPFSFTPELLDAVDAEIREIFESDEILTPDDVRGEAATLREAVLEQGWPAIEDVRGKVFFALDNEGRLRDLYLEGHPSPRGRAMFASVDENHPAAAWFKLNDPLSEFDRIQKLVRSGFLVRTRADANTKQPRDDDPNQRDRAFASGAQFISTDYPEPDRRFSEYVVRLPGGVVARANPVNSRDRDLREDLESSEER